MPVVILIFLFSSLAGSMADAPTPAYVGATLGVLYD